MVIFVEIRVKSKPFFKYGLLKYEFSVKAKMTLRPGKKGKKKAIFNCNFVKNIL